MKHFILIFYFSLCNSKEADIFDWLRKRGNFISQSVKLREVIGIKSVIQIIFTEEPQNSHIYLNSHTLFGLTKMWLFGYAKDIRRIRSLIFLVVELTVLFVTKMWLFGSSTVFLFYKPILYLNQDQIVVEFLRKIKFCLEKQFSKFFLHLWLLLMTNWKYGWVGKLF